MARIRCQYARLSELADDGAQLAERWLSLDERRARDRMHCETRRLTWVSGRVLAKRMLLPLLDEMGRHEITPNEIHIETRSTTLGHGERPVVYVTDCKVDVGMSIAHTSRGVLVALGRDAEQRLGVDLVCRGDVMVRSLQWSLSPRERQWLASSPAHLRTVEQIWALKEALYKAAQCGEGFTPGRIEVVPGREPRYPGLDPAAVRRLESWRIDGHFAALADLVGMSSQCAAASSQPLMAASA
ncbi:MAG: 4'-phosphopantetheinyl transferase superfamily protein [Pirellulales bacterium]